MGRELRRVPPNWEHPQMMNARGEVVYMPMFDEKYETAAAEWIAGFEAWQRGERPEYYDANDLEMQSMHYWEYVGPPPARDCYRKWNDEDATWYQVYETVSEGTPVTPPFETREELIDYLAKNGDFWDQHRRQKQAAGMHVASDCQPWGYDAAFAFVMNSKWAPSMVMDSNGLRRGVDALADQSKTEEVK